MKNKFYVVYDKEAYEHVVNIVIASNVREAKMFGYYTDATTDINCWTHLRAKAIKGGERFSPFYDSLNYIEVLGKGFVYTDLEPQIDTHWDLLINELKNKARYKEVSYEG